MFSGFRGLDSVTVDVVRDLDAVLVAFRLFFLGTVMWPNREPKAPIAIPLIVP